VNIREIFSGKSKLGNTWTSVPATNDRLKNNPFNRWQTTKSKL